MSNDAYNEMFDLKPEERILKILICTKNKFETHLPQVEFADPKQLPHLSYHDHSFDLVLCSDVLFVNQDTELEEAARKTLMELARVGSEVRVFPVVDDTGQPSRYLGSLVQSLQLKGMGVELRHIEMDATGSNAMLRFWSDTCLVKN